MLKMPWSKSKVTFSNPEGRPAKKIDLEQIQMMKQQGKSNREVARILGCSEGTIRSRLK
jgi:DNA-binding CsgD family transcriptional regulator